MILVIPAIQLIDGRCSLSVRGEEGTESLYAGLSDRPAELCSLFRRENAKTIHITDYNPNRNIDSKNLDFIINLAKSVDIPFQALANFASVSDCKYLLDNGVYRIALGELTLIDPEGIMELIRIYTPSRVVGYIDAYQGKVSFRNFQRTFSDHELIQYYKNLGFQRICYKEQTWLPDTVSTDNTGLDDGYGVDFEILKNIGSQSKMRITLYEGITNSQQLWELNSLFRYGIDSVVIGQALYDNNFPCQKIWRIIEADLDK
ncbi:HisA/HisF-related TIM barrel protein [Bacteroidota bacterium]